MNRFKKKRFKDSRSVAGLARSVARDARSFAQVARAARASEAAAAASAVSKAAAARCLERELDAKKTLQGSFSAVSKPNFARKYAFESSRRDLHNALLCTALKSVLNHIFF